MKYDDLSTQGICILEVSDDYYFGKISMEEGVRLLQNVLPLDEATLRYFFESLDRDNIVELNRDD